MIKVKQTEIKIIYVGDSRDVVKRILTNHCKGNVEASALRKHYKILQNIKLAQIIIILNILKFLVYYGL